MNPYYLYCAAVLFIWATASNLDRIASRIILGATLFSIFVTEVFTRQITDPAKLVVPATVEMLTIIALLTLTRNRTGFIQAGLLLVAWATHLLCYADIKLGTNMVYDHYETILWSVSVAQLLAFHDTLLLNLNRVRDWVGRFGHGAVRRPSPASALLHRPGGPGL